MTVLFDGAQVGIRFGGAQVAPDGTFDGSVTVPTTAAPGPHTLLVIGDKGTRYSTTFTVLALAVSPAVAVPNGDVRVSGAGFTPAETVYLSLDGPSSPLFLASRTAGPTGALSPTLVMIPDGTPAATYGLYAVGADSGFVLHTPLQVAAATLTLQPAFGQAGDTLQLSADGFSNGEPVVVYLDDVYQSTIYNQGDNQSLTTCPSGHGTCLVAPLIIPAGTAPGPHTAQVIGFTTGHIVSGALRVYAGTAAPAQGVAGSVVRLGGSGFVPGEALTVTLGLGNGAIDGASSRGGAARRRDRTLPGQATAAAATEDMIVLIAEDERAIAELVSVVVADAGFTPVVAGHGGEALALARLHQPVLVITDLMMPHLTGTELIAALRAEATVHGGEAALLRVG